MRTSVEGVYIVGDAGGVHEGMASNSAIAIDQGRLAGIAVAESLGALDKDRAASSIKELSPSLEVPERDSTAEYRAAWLSSLTAADGLDINVCQCEEVTRAEVLNVTPPRYLQWSSKKMNRRNIETLMEEGPVDLDQLKRLTRAGMGYCQGRRCREEIAMLAARAAGIDVSRIPLASYRPPVRPLPLKVMWPHEEPEELRQNWAYWFKMPEERIKELEEHRKRG